MLICNTYVTCPYLSIDMGVHLFLDVVRSLKPSHIIRLLSKESYVVDTIRHLPPLTEKLFTSTPGLFTPVDRTSDIANESKEKPEQLFNQELLHTSMAQVTATSAFDEVLLGPVEISDDDVDRTQSCDIEMYGSSEEEFSLSDTR